MPDLRKYWADVRAMELSLPEFVWLASIEDLSRGQVGAAIVEVAAAVAAKLLHGRTHRIATDAEVTAYREREDRLKRSAVEESLRRKGIVVVEV